MTADSTGQRDQLLDSIESLAAETGFSGAVRVDVGADVLFARAYGLANRANAIANTVDTRFNIASGTKGLTALAVVSLIEAGLLRLDTPARSILGHDLPLIDDTVTVEDLLAHQSGIGDYIDEDTIGAITDYVLSVPAHELATTEQYLRVLDDHANKFSPREHDLIAQRVCAPAGLVDTAFLRSDELPARTAIGYLDVGGLRTNVFHLPVRGSGDGGIYSTAADVRQLWAAFFGGQIVSSAWIAEMTRPRVPAPADARRYGLGFWLHGSGPVVMLEGSDAGVSFRTAYDPVRLRTWTVLSNTSVGCWPIARRLDEFISG